MDLALLGQPQLVEQGVDVLLDRAFGEEQALGDGRVVLPLRHLLEDLPLSVGQLCERRMGQSLLPVDQPLHDLGVEHRAALGHLFQRADQLIQVGHAFLQQVAQACGAFLQQLVGVVLFGKLRQHHHADVGVFGPDAPGSLEPFRTMGGRHADVREDGARLLLLHGVQQRGEVGHGRHQLDVLGPAEQGRRALPDEVVILGEHDPERHGWIVPSEGRC